MKFHGRIAPGRLTKLTRPVQVILHAPAKASGVTVKIWETDTFDNKKKDNADVLLATFKGDISPAPHSGGSRPPEWRAFMVSDVKLEEADVHVARIKLQFAGSETTYDVPLKSETDQAEGDVFEIGFSIELGGSEKFRTKSPCLVAPPRRSILVTEARVGQYDENGVPAPDTVDERPMALRFAAIGVADGDPKDVKTKLKILGNAYVDQHGYLVAHPDEAKNDDPSFAKNARQSRAVFVYVHNNPKPMPLGPSKIPIAICDPIGDDGGVRVEVPDRRVAWGVQFVERPRDRRVSSGRSRFTPGEPVEVTSPKDTVERPQPHDVIAQIASRFPGGSR